MWWMMNQILIVLLLMSFLSGCSSANVMSPEKAVSNVDSEYLKELDSFAMASNASYLDAEIPLILRYMLEADELNSIVLEKYESKGGSYEILTPYINALCQEVKIQALKLAFSEGVKLEPVIKNNLVGAPTHCLILSIDQANFELFELLLSEGIKQLGDNYIQVDLLDYIDEKISKVGEVKQ